LNRCVRTKYYLKLKPKDISRKKPKQDCGDPAEVREEREKVIITGVGNFRVIREDKNLLLIKRGFPERSDYMPA